MQKKILITGLAIVLTFALFLAEFSRRDEMSSSISGSGSRLQVNSESSMDSVDDKGDKEKLALKNLLDYRIPEDELDAVLAKLSPHQRSKFFEELGKKDFAKAIQFASKTKHPTIYKGRALYGLAQIDAVKALEWALQNADEARLSRNGNYNNVFIRDWSAGVFKTNKITLYNFIEKSEDQEIVRDAVLGIAHGARIRGDYQAVFDDNKAVDLVKLMDPSLLLSLASDWAYRKPVKMLEYTASTKDVNVQRALYTAAIGPYFEINPSEALNWAITVDPNAENGVAASALRMWVYHAKDPFKVQQDLEGKGIIKSQHVDVANRYIAARIGAKDYKAGFKLAREIQSDSLKEEAFKSITLLWAKSMDSKYYDHVISSNDSTLKYVAAISLIDQPAVAAKLIDALPAGPKKDEASNRLLANWKLKDQRKYSEISAILNRKG
jgi:hypothetical protein